MPLDRALAAVHACEVQLTGEVEAALSKVKRLGTAISAAMRVYDDSGLDHARSS